MSSPLHLIHHSQTRQHFNLIPSLPQHIQHLLLLSDATTSSLTFLYELNYATLHKTTHPSGCFSKRQYCTTCTYISNGLTSYTFHPTGETKPITHHITCNSKNRNYMIQCKRCHKQCIGKMTQ